MRARDGGWRVVEAINAAVAEARISADLVDRIGQGDRNAESAMVGRYRRGLLFLLRKRTGDPELAEDMCQETLCIGIEKLRSEPINEPERLAAYLHGVAVNLVRNEWKKSKRRATNPDTEAVEIAAADDPGPFDHLSGEQVREAVRALLNEMTVARDREILTRLYLRDEDREVICEALDLDSTHFNRVLHRAKGRFRELLLAADSAGIPRSVK